MKIPFRDLRTGEDRRRAIDKELKEIKFSEVNRLIKNYVDLREPELMKLRRLIEEKLMSYEEIRRTL